MAHTTKKNLLWSVRDLDAKHRVDGLNLDQILILILGIAPSRIIHWQARKSSTGEWKSLWEFPELGITAPPPLTGGTKKKSKKGSRRISEDTITEGLGDTTLEVDVGEVEDRRNSRRFQKEFMLIVYGEKENFSTKTINISMTGLHVAEDIPNWAGNRFSAVLTKKSERVRVVISRTDPKDARSFSIEEVDPPELLREWLLKW